jgi:hypothetical protein
VGITPLWLEKLLCVLFHELPLDLKVGDRITMHTAQRVASHLSRASTVVREMRAFAFGLYRNMSGAANYGATHLYVNADSVIDIAQRREWARTTGDSAAASEQIARC